MRRHARKMTQAPPNLSPARGLYRACGVALAAFCDKERVNRRARAFEAPRCSGDQLAPIGAVVEAAVRSSF